MKVKKFAAILTGMALIMSDSALVTASDAQTEAGSVVSAGEFVSESEGSDGESAATDVFTDSFSDGFGMGVNVDTDANVNINAGADEHSIIDADKDTATEAAFSDAEALNISDTEQSQNQSQDAEAETDLDDIPDAYPEDEDLTAEASANSYITLGIRGDYIADIQVALDRVNQIRKEACEEAVRDPRDESRFLKPSDYVPLKWSSDLEYIARIRAAEASVNPEHTRPNKQSCFTVASPKGIKSKGEILSWHQAEVNSIVPGINIFYAEKADWVNGNKDAVTGHYTMMINPDYRYVGFSTFINQDGVKKSTTSGEFSSRSQMDETRGSVEKNVTVKVDFSESEVGAAIKMSKNKLEINETAKAWLEFYGCRCRVYSIRGTTGTITWKSSDPSVASVDEGGNVTGVSSGKIKLTAKIGNVTDMEYVTVNGPTAPTPTPFPENNINNTNIKIQVTPTNYTYDGKAKKPSVKVIRRDSQTGKNTDLQEGKDYTLTYTDNINAGEGHITITGKGTYSGKKTVNFTIIKKSPEISASSQDIVLGSSSGKIAKKIVTDGKVTYESSDTKIVAVKGSKFIPKDIGKATITITATEGKNYKKLVKKIFIRVYPQTVSVKTLKSTASRTATVTWTPGKQLTGYQIQYSTQKNMKGARTAAVNTNTDNFTIKRLSQNTTYYVRIRAFKRASNGVRYYSDWGSVKAVTVK